MPTYCSCVCNFIVNNVKDNGSLVAASLEEQGELVNFILPVLLGKGMSLTDIKKKVDDSSRTKHKNFLNLLKDQYITGNSAQKKRQMLIRRSIKKIVRTTKLSIEPLTRTLSSVSKQLIFQELKTMKFFKHTDKFCSIIQCANDLPKTAIDMAVYLLDTLEPKDTVRTEIFVITEAKFLQASFTPERVINVLPFPKIKRSRSVRSLTLDLLKSLRRSNKNLFMKKISRKVIGEFLQLVKTFWKTNMKKSTKISYRSLRTGFSRLTRQFLPIPLRTRKSVMYGLSWLMKELMKSAKLQAKTPLPEVSNRSVRYGSVQSMDDYVTSTEGQTPRRFLILADVPNVRTTVRSTKIKNVVSLSPLMLLTWLHAKIYFDFSPYKSTDNDNDIKEKVVNSMKSFLQDVNYHFDEYQLKGHVTIVLSILKGEKQYMLDNQRIHMDQLKERIGRLLSDKKEKNKCSRKWIHLNDMADAVADKVLPDDVTMTAVTKKKQEKDRYHYSVLPKTNERILELTPIFLKTAKDWQKAMKYEIKTFRGQKAIVVTTTENNYGSVQKHLKPYLIEITPATPSPISMNIGDVVLLSIDDAFQVSIPTTSSLHVISCDLPRDNREYGLLVGKMICPDTTFTQRFILREDTFLVDTRIIFGKNIPEDWNSREDPVEGKKADIQLNPSGILSSGHIAGYLSKRNQREDECWTLLETAEKILKKMKKDRDEPQEILAGFEKGKKLALRNFVRRSTTVPYFSRRRLHSLARHKYKKVSRKQQERNVRQRKRLLQTMDDKERRAKQKAELVQKYVEEEQGKTFEDMIDKFFADLICEPTGQNMLNKLKSGVKTHGIRNVETKQFADLLSNDLIDVFKKHFTNGTCFRDIIRPAIIAKKYRVSKNTKGETVIYSPDGPKTSMDDNSQFLHFNNKTAFHLTFNRKNNIKKIHALHGDFQFNRLEPNEPLNLHYHHREECIVSKANIFTQLEMSSNLEDFMGRVVLEKEPLTNVLKHYRKELTSSCDVVTSPRSRIILNVPHERSIFNLSKDESRRFMVKIENRTNEQLALNVRIEGEEKLFRIMFKESDFGTSCEKPSCEIQPQQNKCLIGYYEGSAIVNDEVTNCSLVVTWKYKNDETKGGKKRLPIEFNI